MAALAEISGVSEPTLFRYFSTKADVLWHGMDESAHAFRLAFAERTTQTPRAVAVTDAYEAMLLRDPDRLSLIKIRAAIIVRDAGAAEASWRKFEEWRALVTEMLATDLGDPANARIRGAMVWAALWSALTAWSVTDDPEPSAQIAIVRSIVSALG